MTCASIAYHFGTLKDPRVERTRWHSLLDIVAIALCAVICGADSWVAVVQFARSKEAWLRTWLKLEGGIPSHDTFGRVFAMLDPEEFGRCLSGWTQAIQEATRGQVCVDGKAARGSRDSVLGKNGIQVVSAWAARNHLVLAQIKVEDKGNEITAIPQLLRMLYLAGCIITIDAIGCQTAIAEQIVAQEADYVLAVKANQGQLHDEIEDLFQTDQSYGSKDVPQTHARTIDKDHGRIEVRECWATEDAGCLAYLSQRQRWPGLRSVAMVRRSRRKNGEDASHQTVETAYYITSLEADATKILQATRTHWSIENSLHWVLDVAFDEDNCRVRTGNAAENLAALRRFALGLLKKDTSVKAGIDTKRMAAGWNESYLLRLINQ